MAADARIVSTDALQVTVSERGHLVTLAGRLDHRSAEQVRDLLRRAVDTCDSDVVVDLEFAEIGDAVGLGVLVGAHRRARRLERRLVLVAVSARSERVLRAARVHRMLHGSERADRTVSPVTA